MTFLVRPPIQAVYNRVTPGKLELLVNLYRPSSETIQLCCAIEALKNYVSSLPMIFYFPEVSTVALVHKRTKTLGWESFNDLFCPYSLTTGTRSLGNDNRC